MNYDEWAEKLLDELYNTPEEHRVSVIKAHLTKAHRRGYTEGSIDDWWLQQDKGLQVPDEDEGLKHFNPAVWEWKKKK